MAKKVKETIEDAGGISSILNLVKSVDNSAEIIQDSAQSNIKEWIPSGNYILNACMSGDLFKAIPTGRIISFCGPSGCMPADEKIEVYVMKTVNDFHHNIYIEAISDVLNVGRKQYCVPVLDMQKELIARDYIANIKGYDVPADELELSEIEEAFQGLCNTKKTIIPIIDLFTKYKKSAVFVNTPDGFQLIGDYVQKAKRDLYIIETANHSIKCSADHLIETETGWVYAKHISVNDRVITKAGIEAVVKAEKYDSDVVYDFEVLHVNHRYWGGSGISSHNTGKSFLACSVCREAQKMGYTPIYMDSEGAIDATFVSRLGVDPSRLIIKQVQTIFETSQFIANLCTALENQQNKTGQHDKVIFVLDSIGNLSSEKEREDTLSGNQKADFTKAKDIKALFRVNATSLAKLQIPMVCCNHTYSSMSFIPSQIQAGGTGLVYNASVTIELSAAKLDDKANETAAKQKAGADQATKNGILVTAKPVKTRFCRPIKTKFQIPFHVRPNPYVGLESFMTWDNSGVVRGVVLLEKDYQKLSDNDKKKVYPFDFNGETRYAQPKDTARGIVVRHLGEAVPLTEFYTSRVFTQEFLEYLNENVIHPMFDLPDQSSFEDIKEIEEALGMAEDDANNDMLDNDPSQMAGMPTTQL